MIYQRPDGQGSRAIGYEVRGEGPAVLLLHPFPFDRRCWAGTTLSGFRLIALDARGFGESALGREELSIDALADDALAVLDHLGVPMTAVVGASMGGYVALSLATRHPQRLSALVLVGSRATADNELARADRDASAAEIRRHGAASFLDDVALRLCGRTSTPALRAQVQALAEAASRDFARVLPAALMALRDRHDHSAALGRLYLPTLVLVGEDDTIAPPDEARAMKLAIPGARFVELPGAGHLPSLETPAAFERALGDFLEVTLAAP